MTENLKTTLIWTIAFLPVAAIVIEAGNEVALGMVAVTILGFVLNKMLPFIRELANDD